MEKIIISFIVLCVSTFSLHSQSKIIKGRVISDDFKAMPLASIMINDTVEVGRTDLNGFFQINIPVSKKKILFRDVGFEQAMIEFVDTCDEFEVVMISSSTYDFKTPKKVDRLRKKKFKTLPELHREAFVKGIFKTDKACYTQEFIPFYGGKAKV